jgi:hypothetical protein
MTPNHEVIRRAENGDPAAQQDLAMTLASGPNANQHHDAILRLLKAAAEHGLVEAQTRLGIALLNGQWGIRDLAQAIHWFERAASENELRAMANLGLLTLLGETGHRDPVSAYRWLYRACLGGDPVGKPFFRQFRKLVSDAELDDAIKTLAHPTLTITFGPPASSDLEAFERYQASMSARQYGDGSPWVDHERQVAVVLFRSSGGANLRPMFSDMFAEHVTVGDYSFATSFWRGLWLATISWSFADLVCGDGLPVAWQPNEEATSALASIVCLLGRRQWVEWTIFTPDYSTDASVRPDDRKAAEAYDAAVAATSTLFPGAVIGHANTSRSGTISLEQALRIVTDVHGASPAARRDEGHPR